MSMFYLNIQKSNIFYYLLFYEKICQKSCKNLWGRVSFPSHHMFLQTAEHLEIFDWKEEKDGKEVISADFVFAHPSSADLLSPLVTE